MKANTRDLLRCADEMKQATEMLCGTIRGITSGLYHTRSDVTAIDGSWDGIFIRDLRKLKATIASLEEIAGPL